MSGRTPHNTQWVVASYASIDSAASICVNRTPQSLGHFRTSVPAIQLLIIIDQYENYTLKRYVGIYLKENILDYYLRNQNLQQ